MDTDRKKVTRMFLCEIRWVQLKPDQLYIFEYDPDCIGCKAYFEGEVVEDVE